MATVEQILTELRQGVDDETWEVYAQQLTAHGAHVADAATDALGLRTVEVTFGRPGAYYVARDMAGQWFLLSSGPPATTTP